MANVRRWIVCGLVVLLSVPSIAPAQSLVDPDAWRIVATRIEAGSEVNVRLLNGQRFTATMIDAREDAVLLQPRTRVPVPVQAISYSAIASLERPHHGGMTGAKAAAIGVAAGVGTFFGILLILFAGLD